MKEKKSERQLGNIRDMIRIAAKANMSGMSNEYLLNHMQRCVDEFNEWLDIVKAEAWDEGFDAGERDVFEHDRNGWDDSPCISNPYKESD